MHVLVHYYACYLYLVGYCSYSAAMSRDEHLWRRVHSLVQRAGADWPSGLQGIYVRWAVQYWGRLGSFAALKCHFGLYKCTKMTLNASEIAYVVNHTTPRGLSRPQRHVIPGPNCGLSPPLRECRRKSMTYHVTSWVEEVTCVQFSSKQTFTWINFIFTTWKPCIWDLNLHTLLVLQHGE